MPFIKNVSGVDRIIPSLGGRLVLADGEVEVPEEAVDGFTCQETNWAPADHKAAKKAAPKKENG